MRLHTTAHSGDLSVDVTASAASDVGSVRRVNEDSFLAASHVFLVADGMGGHNAGDQASQAVREGFARAISGERPPSAKQILDAIAEANVAVRALAVGPDGTRSVSGTTLAGVAIVESAGGLQWMAFNIGDSRIYEFDGRSLTQLSVDHSAVQELVDDGLITLAEAGTHPDRNVITRAIGATDVVDADVWLIPMTGSQCFLLCSDGLNKEISTESIASILASHDPAAPSTVADELVGAAVAAGGADNVTAIVVESTSVVELQEHTSERIRTESRMLEETRPRI